MKIEGTIEMQIFQKLFSNKIFYYIFLFILKENMLISLLLGDFSHNVAISLMFIDAATSSAVNRF